LVNTIEHCGIDMRSNVRISEEAFANVVHDLMVVRDDSEGKVTRKDYDRFCREYIFDVLKSADPFGIAFCNEFIINDFMLSRVHKRNVDKCKEIIEESGYIKE
jgi:hypothetical protein